MAKGVMLCILLAMVLGVFSINGVKAGGLSVTGPYVYVNKTVGVDASTLVYVTNTAGFTFYNISFDTNAYMTMSKIDVLAPNSTAVINATVFGDTAVNNASVRIKGYYIMNVGQNPQTYQINITQYASTPAPCDFTVVKGDSVNWNVGSSLLQSIEIRQDPYNSGVNTIVIMTGNQSFTKQFTSAGAFKYRFYVGGFSPAECTITVLDDNGLVNNPQYDGIAFLTINTTNLPTSVAMTVLTTNYTMNFYGSQDGLMSVTNTGNNTAVGVKLSGDWFSFSTNNFNLAAGETKGIVFTIKPTVSTTNQTNQTYSMPIRVDGNFIPIATNISIFINYANIDTNISSASDLEYFKNIFCVQYPNSMFCNPEPKVVYKYVDNGSLAEFNVTLNQEKLNQLWINYFQMSDEIKTLSNYIKENSQDTTANIRNSTQDLAAIKAQTEANRVNQEQSQNNLVTLIIIVTLGICCAIVAAIIFMMKKKADLERLRRVRG